ncbi:MAG TPA: Gfo/Idh/MocA family oxidoreductase [Acidimicrobiales bacterium]|jgi:predicted dehydrogenase
MGEPVRLAVVGAGSRGTTYSHHAVQSGRAKVVAVAEPVPARRAAFAQRFGVPAAAVFDGWEALAAVPRQADAAVVATQDRLHVAPALALAERGYHVLLEKPIAPTLAEAERIVEGAERAGIVLTVCHVMRYTGYTRRLIALIGEGAVGEIVSVEHLEPVGWWHFAHSYVRGNWRREDEASPMLLAKSCHDIDWLGYVIGRRVRRVASFGGLYHFRPDQRPAEAADRCLDCSLEPTCPYSAPRLYRAALRRRGSGAAAAVDNPSDWPLSVITDDPSPDGVERALRSGPYGRCVYGCDNDVVDHQVVSLEYDGGVTASFTMTAFTPLEDRKTRIFGTHGFIDGDGRRFRLVDFRNGRDEIHDVDGQGDASAAGGHGGGDAGVVEAFLDAVAHGDPGAVLTGPRESLESHRIVWAAEQARLTGTVVSLD